MKKSGKTPLLRARNIENKLGIKRIYIKLEGTNPSGSKHDRFVERIVFSAIAQNKQVMIANGSKPYLKALKYFCDIYKIELKVFQFKNQKWKEKLGDNIALLDYKDKVQPINYKIYEQYPLDSLSYRAIEGLDHLGLAETAYMEIAEEIIKKMKHPTDTVFYTHSVDYQSSIYNGYLLNYMSKRHLMPTIYPVSYDDYDDSEIKTDLLDKAYNLLTKLEHLKLKKKEALPFALFLSKLDKQLIDKGHHVIIIDQAKTRVNIKRLESFDDISKSDILSYVDHYLDRYSDPLEDASDALDNAMEKGFILYAARDELIDGVCVVVNMGFEKFIPTYHLAYIGTNSNSKGRGLGTELIEYAVDLTDGRISLHVDLDNYRAKKLYEKMGFKHVYNRMIFQREE